MSGTKKCAHEGCNCQISDGKKYCSAKCESAKKVTELTCQCGHPGCTGQQLRT